MLYKDILNTFKNDKDKEIDCIIQRFKEGDLSILPEIYIHCISDNKEIINKCTNAITYIVSKLSNAKIIELNEMIKQYSSINWFISWEKVELENIIKNIINKTDIIYFLGVGTFLPNGYYREKCLDELEKYNNYLSMPFVLLRINDWVKPIREKAYKITLKMIEQYDIEKIIYSFTYLYKLKNCQRRDDILYKNLCKAVEMKITNKNKHILISKFMDIKSRRFCYELLLRKDILSLNEYIQILDKEKEVYNRIFLSKLIIQKYNDNIDFIDYMLTSKYYDVRLLAFYKKYEIEKKPWYGIENYLLDSSSSIRNLIKYIIKKQNNDFDFEKFYIDNLNQYTEISILGLGETGEKANKEIIKRYLDSENIRVLKAIIISLKNLCADEEQELYFKFLLDARKGISKTAFIIIKSINAMYDYKDVYNAFIETKFLHVKLRLCTIIENSKYLDIISYLILMTSSDIEYINNIAEKYLSSWKITQNFKKPTQRQKNFIKELLYKEGNNISEKLKDDIILYI